MHLFPQKQTTVDLSKKLYSNTVRKHELVEMLKENLDFHLNAADILDKKAWDVLSVTSATFGFLATIQIINRPSAPNVNFWAVFIIVICWYIFQVREVLEAVKPREWNLVPGVRDGKISYEALMAKYIPIDEDAYLNQLIADYAGAQSKDDPNTFVLGSIQIAAQLNDIKAKHIRRAALTLVFIIGGLMAMAVVTNI